MNLYLARDLARTLIRQHGLVQWSFAYDHARRRFGSCQPTRKVITLSKHLVFLNDEEQVRDTILHEIAHALTPGDGHGRRWRAKCLEVGAKPSRCYTDEDVTSPPRRPAAFQMGCERCGWWVDRRRQTRRRLVCKACRSPVVIRNRNEESVNARTPGTPS